ncbi:MAG: acyl-CoA reductase, partial [Candidatus Acidiferrum sp.]
QKSWCLRLARDVWQFDQQACSSPQVLFLEKQAGQSAAQFISNLQRAFETENRAHPRREIPAVLTSTICQARASWLLNDTAHRAAFPAGPDWTLLLGSGVDLPQPVQGKTLTVLEVDDLLKAISKWDGNVQTLGLGMADPEREKQVTFLAGKKGVDRIVKLGRMHVFVSPWDGMDLVRPMVRMVRHVSSTE